MTRHPSKLFQLNPLFAIYGNGSAVMPNTQTLQTSQTSLMLEFLGKLFASFFVTNDILAVELPPLFWKLLVGEKTTANDLVSLDSTLKDTLDPVTLLQTTETDLEDRFPGVKNLWSDVVANHPSLLLDVQLPPDDMEGAELLARCIVENTIDCFRVCIDHMRRGFHQVLPLYTLEAFRWQTVELAICGAKKLSFEAFKRECDIQLGTAEADMFLEVLQSMTDEDRALLLRFITGQSRLPLKSRIKIQSSGTKNTLPTSSTCFFTFRVPSYTSSQIMMDRLLYAARQCKAIDADGQAREIILNS
ncbi:hypothetical protein AGDE_02045 [Angomonas deanei]|nr:hypothetical protein AGDE_02045 [Angomonas deanei]|eukprot:EPY41878.1 hypothetical protein AGDE_02045 [Angomonas deanei]